jgi:hypothetical protein
MTEILHLKSEDMKFSQFYRDAGGHMTQCRLVTPEISTSLGAGIATYDGCSIEWTTKYQQVAIVLEGVLRIRTGENYSRVIEAKVGDVLWFPKGTPLKYEGDKAKIFYAPAPNDWRINSATTVVDAAIKHFRDQKVQHELVSTIKVENWTAYEVKAFLDLLIVESSNRKLSLKGFRMPSNWFNSVGAKGNAAQAGTYHGIPITVVGEESIEIVLLPA